MRILSAVAIAIGARSPVVAMPGPADASAAPRAKYMIGTSPTRPRQTHRIASDDIERAVDVRLREQQRDAGQRQEQVDREPGRHVAQRQVADVDADDPGERQREQPTFSRDVQDRQHDGQRWSVTAPRLIERS